MENIANNFVALVINVCYLMAMEEPWPLNL
jgi:hypothetical protein